MTDNTFDTKASKATEASKEVSKEVSKGAKVAEVGKVIEPGKIVPPRQGLRVSRPLGRELDSVVYALIGIGMDVHSAFWGSMRMRL